METHPPTTHLERFARGVCTSSERQQVVRHLLRGCTLCGAQLRDLLQIGVRKVRTAATAGRAQPACGPRLRALLLRRQAALKGRQRNFRQAVRLVAEAAEIFRALGERQELGRCLLEEGIFTANAGRAKEGLRLVFESLRLIEGDVDLACQAVLAVGRLSIDVGEPELGLKLLVENRPLFERSGQPAALLRMSWLFGELEHALNLLQPTESNLLHARRGFVKAGMAYETALVSLELTMIYLKMEKLGELAALVEDMLPIFRSLGVKRETFASLILWKQAEGKATLAVLQQLATDLKRKLHRFQG